MASQQGVKITADHLAPAVEIVIWLCMIIAVVTTLIRSAVKLWVIRRFECDDYLIASSTVLAVAQSLAIFVATENGLGDRADTRDASLDSSVFKARYASQLLFIMSLTLSKLALARYVQTLSRTESNKRIFYGLLAAIVVWAITSIFPLAFECGLPQPWDLTQATCANLVALTVYVGVLSIVTELVLIAQPLLVIRHLQVDLSKKMIIYGVFASRVAVPIAIACQIVYSAQALSSTDRIYSLWSSSICTQLVQCISILTASTVYLKPFVDSLQSGFMHTGDLRRRYEGDKRYSKRYGTKSSGSQGRGGNTPSRPNFPGYSRDQRSQYDEELSRLTPGPKLDGDSAASVPASELGNGAANQPMHITHTISWTVEDSGEAQVQQPPPVAMAIPMQSRHESGQNAERRA